MLRVIRNHRRAAYNAPSGEYERLSVSPQGIDGAQAPTPMLRAARESWDRALAGGELYGFRNAQTTLLAPTGTIGLLMDCDTTGVEPDFALVKFKKLAGGGYFKIANQSIEPALRNLGYTAEQRKDILTYVLGTLSLDGTPHINRESLTAKGFIAEDIAKIEKALPGVFELGFAFNAWTLGDEAMARVGITKEQSTTPGFDLLTALGFSRKQIDEANEAICGTMTVEGAPLLNPEHLPVFDCANKCGKKGTRFIHHLGHITMMGATQPFLSGAISKTINMPNEATVEDITDAYMQSWKYGVKAMALYRDGSKLSQPLSTKSDTKESTEATVQVGVSEEEVEKRIADAVAAAVAKARTEWDQEQAEREPAPLVASAVPVGIGTQQLSFVATPRPAPYRRRLPSKRRGFTQEARVAGNKIYMRTGEYEDGTLGEVFIDMHKEGAAFRSMINCFAISISKGLQYGVPLDEYVDTFTFTRFEPQGMITGHPNIKFATSVIDYVFRVLGLEYLGRTDLVQVPPDAESEDEDGPSNPIVAATSGVSPLPTFGESDETPLASPTPAVATSGFNPASILGSYANGHGHSNGHSNGTNGISTPAPALASMSVLATASAPVNVLDAQLAEMMGDAPFCDICGHITVRNGACYKCLNCGNSLGCS